MLFCLKGMLLRLFGGLGALGGNGPLGELHPYTVRAGLDDDALLSDADDGAAQIVPRMPPMVVISSPTFRELRISLSCFFFLFSGRMSMK